MGKYPCDDISNYPDVSHTHHSERFDVLLLVWLRRLDRILPSASKRSVGRLSCKDWCGFLRILQYRRSRSNVLSLPKDKPKNDVIR